ncbi:cytoplasmic dynein 2 intermediate chain 1 isoform X2 [Haemaphysalis longicornis]
MCAEQVLASWGDLQPLRSKMSQKPKATGHKAGGTQAKPPEAHRKSTHDGASGSKSRSVSKENDRREGAKKTAEPESKRSSSQHEPKRKTSISQDPKKPGAQRDTKPTSRLHEGKRAVGTDSRRLAVGEEPKGRDARKSQPATVHVRSTSQHRKEADISTSRRQSRSIEKGRPVDTPSPIGTSEKRTTTATVVRATPGSKSRHVEKAAPKGISSTASPKKQSALSSKPGKTDERPKERRSPYDKSGASKTARKTQKGRTADEGRPPSETEHKEAPQRRTSTASRKSRTVTRRETYSAEEMQQVGSEKATSHIEISHDTLHTSVTKPPDEPPPTTEKDVPQSSAIPKARHPSVADDTYSYDDDFEEYESDFEADEDDVSSSHSTNSTDSAVEKSEDEKSSSNAPASMVTEDSGAPALNDNENIPQVLSQQPHWKSEPALDASTAQPATVIPTSFSTHALIKYIEAAQKSKNPDKVLSKAQQRAKDVLEMVSLDTMTFQVFDIPPISYDVYIRLFGRSNAKQVLLQTDLGDDEECQTEAIELKDKWTQQPPHDYRGFGGSEDTGPVDGAAGQYLQTAAAHVMDLLDFLNNSSSLILRVMEEDLASKTRRDLKQVAQVESFSDGFLRLGPVSFLKGSRINFVHFSPPCPNYLVTGHDMTSLPEDSSLPGDTIMGIWNLNNPTRPTDFLISHCQVTCCRWSPLDAVSLATGSFDGSLEVWDLREKFSLSKDVALNEGTAECGRCTMKLPAYTTASLFDSDCHVSPIVDICCWTPSGLLAKQYAGSRSARHHRAGQSRPTGGYNLWSLDEEGTLVSWAVVEAKSQPEGSLADLGLAPGAVLSLVRNAVFLVRDFLPQSYEQTRDGLRTFGFAQLNATRVLVTTDIVATKNGGLRLHFLEYERAVWEWNPADGPGFAAVHWSPRRPVLLYAATASGDVATWDLSLDGKAPTSVAKFPSSRVLAMDVNHTLTSTSMEPCLALAMDDGTVQVHLLEADSNESLRLDCEQIERTLLAL